MNSGGYTGPVYNPFDSDWTVPPGEMLKEALEETCRTPAGLAQEVDMPLEHVESIIAAEVELTEQDAILLETGTGIPVRLWMRMEANYRRGSGSGEAGASVG